MWLSDGGINGDQVFVEPGEDDWYLANHESSGVFLIPMIDFYRFSHSRSQLHYVAGYRQLPYPAHV